MRFYFKKWKLETLNPQRRRHQQGPAFPAHFLLSRPDHPSLRPLLPIRQPPPRPNRLQGRPSREPCPRSHVPTPLYLHRQPPLRPRTLRPFYQQPHRSLLLLLRGSAQPHRARRARLGPGNRGTRSRSDRWSALSRERRIRLRRGSRWPHGSRSARVLARPPAAAPASAGASTRKTSTCALHSVRAKESFFLISESDDLFDYQCRQRRPRHPRSPPLSFPRQSLTPWR